MVLRSSRLCAVVGGAAEAERMLRRIENVWIDALGLRIHLDLHRSRHPRGTIVFPPSWWGGTRVQGLVLTFDRGRVTAGRTPAGADAVAAELGPLDGPGRSFREFALGFNPLLAVPADDPPWIPYYGYGAGVVRLSLGDNTELGGNVRGGYVRWNFFTDATVTVGTDVWVKDGTLIKR